MRTVRGSVQDVEEYGLLLLGALVQAIGLRLFLVPASLASGGISGISQLIHHFTGWPIGLMVLAGNVPLFLLGWRFLGGWRFAVRTGLVILIYSLSTDLLPLLPFFPAHGLTDDIVLNSLYGAIVSGAGYGLVYRARATSGGSDILARILQHRLGVPMTQSYLMVDSLVILSAGFVFGWKEALYALIALYVSGLVAETILEGNTMARTALIITNQEQALSQRILRDMGRGVTILYGKGAYTGEARRVLYTVITRPEVSVLKTIVREVDPAAFFVIGQAHEVLGEGFKAIDEGR
jgi:uncharacterized membrane-anchored protein YitT (DUF2179 family)